MFFIYILQSEPTGKFYVGYSKDPQRRFVQHNETSFDSYTSKFRPWSIKAILPIGTEEADAVQVERYIKKQKQRRFIKLVIEKASDENFISWLKKESSAG